MAHMGSTATKDVVLFVLFLAIMRMMPVSPVLADTCSYCVTCFQQLCSGLHWAFLRSSRLQLLVLEAVFIFSMEASRLCAVGDAC